MTTASSPTKKTMRAGGRANEGGMAFQAAVGTWIAAHLLARLPVGGRFGINNIAVPTAIRLETGEGLDDIEVTQSDGGAIHIQCKTRADLGTGPKAALTKTVEQLATWVADTKRSGLLPDLTKNAAILAVRQKAPATLDTLEAGCRAFDLGGSWAVTKGQRNQAEQAALSAFETIARPAWASHRNAPPGDDDLTDMARIFRIRRFSMDEGDADWREASSLLGRALFGNQAAGDAPLRDLQTIVRGLIGSGAPADRAGLLRALRRLGHNDIASPAFEADLARIRAATEAELDRLSVHRLLPLGPGIPIARESDGPLLSAIEAGSLLVVGEPGAGKTGALVNAATSAKAAGSDVVFLSVDRFPGVAIAPDLAAELGLQRPLIEVLEAFPGSGRKILIIDALDAARGGSSEGVFASLLEGARARLGEDWLVVASIRTFDLKNGRRFRQAFAGAPADQDHAEPGLAAVRHFLVPRLSEADLEIAAAASPELAGLLASAPERLTQLFRNVFNLSLAAQLLADDAEPDSFSAIGTQSGLIDAYEDIRLNRTALQQCAAVAASVMAARRRLSVRKVAIDHTETDAVIATGVLAEAGDLVSFAHHVLFDHVAGRFHLAWDDPDALIAQLAGDASTALLLSPALRFAVERLWRFDAAGRPLSWKLLAGIFSATNVDAVLGNVALRIIVEHIADESDLAGLIDLVAAAPGDPALARILARLSRFASMDIEVARSIGSAQAIAWARLAEALVATGERTLADPARVLLHAIFEHGDLTEQTLLTSYGRAARALLTMAWAGEQPLLATSVSAIRFVGKSFSSDTAASRLLLDQILREPHFSQFADREATWLAEQIVPITRGDPEFTVEIYSALYGQTISDDSTSWFGGHASRIMPLSSNRRQDYQHCRWQLGTSMGQVLGITPYHGTRALIDALIGKVATRGYGGADEPDLIDLGDRTIELRAHDIELNQWDEEGDEHRDRDDDILRHYVAFLRGADLADFTASVDAASRGYATALVWTRIFGVGSERVSETADLLWPILEHPDFLELGDTLRDAVRFVAAAWPIRSAEERIRFETMALNTDRFSDDADLARWHRILGRIFALVPEEALELEATRALRRQLVEENLLTANEPLARYTSSWGEHRDFVRDQLRRDGANLEDGPLPTILDASDALYAQLQATPSTASPTDLASLWRAALALLALVDENPDLPDQADRASWGNVSNAVERVAASDNYTPGEDGLPELPEVFAVLRRLSNSKYPEPRESDT